MYKQLIIARKDLNMSPGKLAAQVSHGSMAFLTCVIRNNVKKIINENVGRAYDRSGKPQLYLHPDLNNFAEITRNNGKKIFYYMPENQEDSHGKQVIHESCTINKYRTSFDIDKDLYEQWINGCFTKVVCEAKNKNQLLRAKEIAKEMSLVEDEDFFLIRDNCCTELEPEEVDENGVGRTLTCIGFKPMESEIIEKISKKYNLYS